MYYEDVLDNSYEWECAMDDEEYERNKKLNAFDDIAYNIEAILDILSEQQLQGSEELQKTLFVLCNLLDIDTSILKEKISNIA